MEDAFLKYMNAGNVKNYIASIAEKDIALIVDQEKEVQLASVGAPKNKNQLNSILKEEKEGEGENQFIFL